MGKITGTITVPKEVMDEVAQKPMIEEAVLLVGILAVITAAAAYIQVGKISYVYEGFDGGLPPGAMEMGSIFGVIMALIGIFISWIIMAAIVQLISVAIGGEGKFTQMLVIGGYSVIPLILGGLVMVLLTWMTDPVTVTVSATNPFAAGEMMKELTSSPLYMTMDGVRILTKIWATFIIFLGVQSAHKLSPGGAAAAAGIPLVLSLVVTYGPRFMF